MTKANGASRAQLSKAHLRPRVCYALRLCVGNPCCSPRSVVVRERNFGKSAVHRLGGGWRVAATVSPRRGQRAYMPSICANWNGPFQTTPSSPLRGVMGAG